MKNIVLKVPTGIFVVLVALPFLILGLQIVADKELLDLKYYVILRIVGLIVSSIWLFSIVDYFHSKKPDFKYIRLTYFFLALGVIFNLLFTFDLLPFQGIVVFLLGIFRLLFFVPATVFITLLIREVFYERAVWFIVLEVLIVIVGITTLTPEIKRNELETLSEDLDKN